MILMLVCPESEHDLDVTLLDPEKNMILLLFRPAPSCASPYPEGPAIEKIQS